MAPFSTEGCLETMKEDPWDMQFMSRFWADGSRLKLLKLLIAGLGEVGDEDGNDDILVVEGVLDEILGDVVDLFTIIDCAEELETEGLITFLEFVACLPDNDIGRALEVSIGTACPVFLLEATKISFCLFDSTWGGWWQP